MGKKNPYVMTIGFNRHDPAHVEVAQFLNGMERGRHSISWMQLWHIRMEGQQRFLFHREQDD